MTTRARDFKFAGAIVQRLYLVMVALTKNRLSAQYGWFCHERSHMYIHVCTCTCTYNLYGKVIQHRPYCDSKCSSPMHCRSSIVSDPTLEEGKGSGDFGQNLGPVDDLRRNLRIPIRLYAAIAQSYMTH